MSQFGIGSKSDFQTHVPVSPPGFIIYVDTSLCPGLWIPGLFSIKDLSSQHTSSTKHCIHALGTFFPEHTRSTTT